MLINFLKDYIQIRGQYVLGYVEQVFIFLAQLIASTGSGRSNVSGEYDTFLCVAVFKKEKKKPFYKPYL